MIEGYSSDWVFDVQNGNITRVGKGGTDTYNMAGISYWKRSDALIIKKQLKHHIRNQDMRNYFGMRLLIRN